MTDLEKYSTFPVSELRPQHALRVIDSVLLEGLAKHGKDTWRKLPLTEHWEHARLHLEGFEKQQNLEDISHAVCRLLFALEQYYLATH